MNQGQLRKEIQEAVNRNSCENGSNTPDFILAQYLIDCLRAFDRAVNKREQHYRPAYSIPTESPLP